MWQLEKKTVGRVIEATAFHKWEVSPEDDITLLFGDGRRIPYSNIKDDCLWSLNFKSRPERNTLELLVSSKKHNRSDDSDYDGDDEMEKQSRKSSDNESGHSGGEENEGCEDGSETDDSESSSESWNNDEAEEDEKTERFDDASL